MANGDYFLTKRQTVFYEQNKNRISTGAKAIFSLIFFAPTVLVAYFRRHKI